MLWTHVTHHTPETTPVPPPVDTLAIDIKPRNDNPQFGRTYKIPITSDVKLTIDAYSFLGKLDSRSFDGELRQRNGDWVLFDPRHPAKKILDREILPIIEKYCAMILAMDKQYMDSDPDTFIDKHGDTWKKVTNV